MSFVKTTRHASIVLVAILLAGTNYKSTQATYRYPQIDTQHPRPKAGTLPSTTDPQPSSSAHVEWETKRDWMAFTSNIIGDDTVKDSLKQLLASGVDVNTKDKLGRTALHVAAMLGQTAMARYLLLEGAKVDTRDHLGRTALMISASLGGLKLFTGLSAPWFRFWSEPLCAERSASSSSSHMVNELMNWYSVAPAHRPLVQLLIAAGADVNALDNEGQTVLDYAGVGGLTDIDSLILKSGRVRDRKQCELKLVQALTLRGFRLGMTLPEAAARFPSYVLPSADSCGRLNLTFSAFNSTLRAYAQRPEEFNGVARIDMTFLDERLTYIRVTYDPNTVWKNTNEYLATLSTSLGIPLSWYKAADGVTADNAHMVGCDGFKVIAGIYRGPYVELHDTEALLVMLRRKVEVDSRRKREDEEEQERRRRTFKP